MNTAGQENGSLCFLPAYPMQAGVTYRRHGRGWRLTDCDRKLLPGMATQHVGKAYKRRGKR